MKKKPVIGVIGLGYVGLPLAVAFSKHFDVVGFDINHNRVQELKNCYDNTLEISKDDLLSSMDSGLVLSSEESSLETVNTFIVTVPTPVNHGKQPDLNPLISASNLVSQNLKSGDIVVYESTVFPGCTEEVCVPVLEGKSGLILNKGFFVGYSPERINPGDKEHTLANITKIVSGSNRECLEYLVMLYGTIVSAGIHPAESIAVAEAAKVIENCQRDINIAFINELAVIFSNLNIDTASVLKAAGTKWNFLKFFPGLVGGHCIGVDPYYLTYKAQMSGYYPEVILSGRRINDSMHKHVASSCIKELISKNYNISTSNILVLGLTFKENCPDIRNSKVFDLIEELNSYKLNISVYDPYVKNDKLLTNSEAKMLQSEPKYSEYDLIIHAVKHNEYEEPLSKLPENALVYKIFNMSF